MRKRLITPSPVTIDSAAPATELEPGPISRARITNGTPEIASHGRLPRWLCGLRNDASHDRYPLVFHLCNARGNPQRKPQSTSRGDVLQVLPERHILNSIASRPTSLNLCEHSHDFLYLPRVFLRGARPCGGPFVVDCCGHFQRHRPSEQT